MHMPQFLKDDIYDRIYEAGVSVFYDKDYRSAKMKDIAQKAGISVSLVYSYFQNKEALFEKIVAPAYGECLRIAREEEDAEGLPYEKYKTVSRKYLLDLLDRHKALVILVDKSRGTKYENAKDSLVGALEAHIRKELPRYAARQYPDMLIHILASNFTESLLEIARHYESRESAREMLELMTRCYYQGVNSL